MARKHSSLSAGYKSDQESSPLMFSHGKQLDNRVANSAGYFRAPVRWTESMRSGHLAGPVCL